MNVWEYLDRNDLCDTVVGALGNLRITQDQRDETVAMLKRFQLVLNSRAKSRFGAIRTRRTKNQITGEITVLSRNLELTSEYFTHGYNLRPEHAADHNNTLLHETAHIITDVVRPDASSHGQEWKAVMRALGANSARIGSSDVLQQARDAGYKHSYTCQGCGYEYKTKRALKNPDKRWHSDCGKVNGRLVHRQLR